MEKIQSKIGAICINFETLDLTLSACVGRFISKDSKIGAIMTTDVSFARLCDAFSSLVKYKFAENLDFISEVNKLIVVLSESEAKRNHVIHSAYYFNDLENDKNSIGSLKITARRKKGLMIGGNNISETDLKEINEKIIFGIQELKSLYSHLFPGEQISYA